MESGSWSGKLSLIKAWERERSERQRLPPTGENVKSSYETEKCQARARANEAKVSCVIESLTKSRANKQRFEAGGRECRREEDI